jgi:hypothetical protein
MEKLREKEKRIFPMAIFMRVILKINNKMDMGKWSISMVTFIKENGRMIKNMEKEK